MEKFVLNILLTTFILSICISALCSICEAVLYSISTSQVEMLKKSGHSSADILQNLRTDIDEPITALLTLNTIANTIGAAIIGALAAKLYGDQYLIWFSVRIYAFHSDPVRDNPKDLRGHLCHPTGPFPRCSNVLDGFHP